MMVHADASLSQEVRAGQASPGQRLHFTDLLMDPDMDGFAEKLAALVEQEWFGQACTHK